MTTFNKLHGGTIIASIIAAIAMISTARLGDTWLYILIAWLVLFAVLEVYYGRKNKKQ